MEPSQRSGGVTSASCLPAGCCYLTVVSLMTFPTCPPPLLLLLAALIC